MFFGGLLWLALLATIIYVIVTHIHQPRPNTQRPGDDPIEILKQRYARGELSRDDYEQMRRDLAA